jgi:hypothetical protein
MKNQFSKNLRERVIKYFQEYHGLVVSDDQAVLFLDSSGDLFIAFESLRRPARRQARRRLRRQDSQYLT